MRALIISTIVSLFVVACAAEDTNSLSNGTGAGGRGGTSGEVPGAAPAGTTPGGDPTQPGTCKEGVPHPGFANVDFIADRKPGAIGVDRRRVRPYSALSSEFQRALGTVPADLATSVAAYGEIPARWFAEPTAGAISTYVTYNLSFTSCFDTLTAPNFADAPTAATAPVECAKMQRKFWQRSASPEETQACADFVLGLTEETVGRRRWAHACASIMASAGFTTY